MFILALSAGHGKYTAGKRCDVALDPAATREWVLNSRICEKLIERLSHYDGIKVIRLDDPTGKQDVALKTRVGKANRERADLYLSIHHNAGIKCGTGGGIVAYVYPRVDGETLSWQREFYEAAVEKTGLFGNRKTPLAKKDLYVLRETAMPAVLLECGFMDSKTDIKHILTDEFASGIAAACAEVIIKRASLAPKSAPPCRDRYFARYEGETHSIVMALKSIGADSSYAYRRQIAAKNKIENYSGTAAQNLYMLSLLKKGELLIP